MSIALKDVVFNTATTSLADLGISAAGGGLERKAKAREAHLYKVQRKGKKCNTIICGLSASTEELKNMLKMMKKLFNTNGKRVFRMFGSCAFLLVCSRCLLQVASRPRASTVCL